MRISFLKKLYKLSPRLWENERKTASFLKREISKKKKKIKVQKYEVIYPIFEKYYLFADGKRISCLPSGFKSGEIKEKVILDSVHISGRKFSEANINFNPYCLALSKPTFYNAPSLAVASKDLQKIIKAKKIKGILKVSWKKYTQENILVGNFQNPYRVVFSHYDSWWGGVIDNGVACFLLFELLEKIDLKKNLIVFAGSEELSNEFPYYWCYGYRMFENEFFSLLEKAKEILVIDSVGYSKPKLYFQKKFLKEAFLIKNKNFWKKTKLLSGDFLKLMEIYHSPEDNLSKALYLNESQRVILDLLK